MAKLERELQGDAESFINYIHQGIVGGSISATYEDGSDWRDGDVRVITRVYERYSWLGGNRVSLSVTLVGKGRDLFLSAVTAGGSQAMFFKINTFGEQSFLNKLENLISRYDG
ncbi:MAG: DUF6054 family protein [Christensenellales bacterium]|jgi:hypothetical protein